MVRYLIVIEKANGNYSASSPDLPGCIATGSTPDEVARNMQEAVEFHLHGSMEDNVPIPAPQSIAEYISVPLDQYLNSKGCSDKVRPFFIR